MESFSERLIHLRHSNNLTRKQVRESLDINESTYNRWENGSRTPDNETIVRFANFFKVSPMYMLGISHLRNGEEYLLDVLENIESDETIEGLKAKAGLAEYRKEFLL
ncbi:helix-turn-helix domain-containing protein [Lactococcus lactis]|uniref:helix-turn-helix domain-containing protein n=1 Tax=Lactococcus lactis TaxID=1358 RepID=UPI00241659E5|nr:helix-turn-helix transcriptional regulator [Lactococcus lactis]MDG4969503.1 helix-turn-helix domain-containing protein [Lactococcus lactis]MDG5102748.1 helix-turn-helix domain-containing protein [Lactococcus lactis]